MSLMKSFVGSGLMLFWSLALSCPGVAAPLITYRLDTPKAGLMTSVAPSQRAGPATTVNDRPSGSIGLSGQAGNDNPSKALDTSSVASTAGRFRPFPLWAPGRRSPSKLPSLHPRFPAPRPRMRA